MGSGVVRRHDECGECSRMGEGGEGVVSFFSFFFFSLFLFLNQFFFVCIQTESGSALGQ